MIGAACLGWVAAWAGPDGSALGEITDRGRTVKARAAAVDVARRQAQGDDLSMEVLRKTFKDVAWATAEPLEVRLAILTLLMNDTDPRLAADGRLTAKLMLPREPMPEIVKYLAKACADRGWTDATPSLVRSYARPMGKVADADRPERAALVRLNAGRAPEDIAMELFVSPPTGLDEQYGKDWTKRLRADAWDLLGRIDADGSHRTTMLASPAVAGGDEVVSAVRDCVRELRAMPLAGGELDWAVALRDAKRPEIAAWWAQASAAMPAVERQGPFGLRHVEAVRWLSAVGQSADRRAWLGMTREDLLRVLHARLDPRQIRVRTVEQTPGEEKVREKLAHVEARLTWADVLVVLCLDEIVRRPEATRTLFEQADLDRKDTTTEYGGLLLPPRASDGVPGSPPPPPTPTPAAGGTAVPDATAWYVPRLFPPQAGQRRNDRSFDVSDDMIRASDRAIAQYHFHVQSVRNSEFAGPSPEDRAFAKRWGRNCLVVTSVNDEEMDVDYYQPNGVVVDLGTIRRSK